ncbi:hypothetical protein VR611_02140 [Aquirufa nivalisilvae]
MITNKSVSIEKNGGFEMYQKLRFEFRFNICLMADRDMLKHFYGIEYTNKEWDEFLKLCDDFYLENKHNWTNEVIKKWKRVKAKKLNSQKLAA